MISFVSDYRLGREKQQAVSMKVERQPLAHAHLYVG